METYEEMIPQFASLMGFSGKEKWLEKLPLEKLKIFKSGLNNDPLRNSSFEQYSWTKTWIPIIEELINQKIIETRNWKINQIIK